MGSSRAAACSARARAFPNGLAREGDGHDFLGPVHRGSARMRSVNSSVLPDPAGACTRNERDGSPRRVVVGQAFLFRHLGVLVVQVQPQERQGVAGRRDDRPRWGHARGVFVSASIASRQRWRISSQDRPSKYLLSSASVTPAMPRSTSAGPAPPPAAHGSAPAPARPPRRRRRQPAHGGIERQLHVHGPAARPVGFGLGGGRAGLSRR